MLAAVVDRLLASGDVAQAIDTVLEGEVVNFADEKRRRDELQRAWVHGRSLALIKQGVPRLHARGRAQLQWNDLAATAPRKRAPGPAQKGIAQLAVAASQRPHRAPGCPTCSSWDYKLERHCPCTCHPNRIGESHQPAVHHEPHHGHPTHWGTMHGGGHRRRQRRWASASHGWRGRRQTSSSWMRHWESIENVCGEILGEKTRGAKHRTSS